VRDDEAISYNLGVYKDSSRVKVEMLDKDSLRVKFGMLDTDRLALGGLEK
jgi:hypothetical protein